MYLKLTGIGYLGGDPELRYTPTGQQVCNFSVATNRRWKNTDGSPGEETTWLRLTAWGKLAEHVNQYLHKGSKIYFEGKLTPDKQTGGPRMWNDQNGNMRASYEVRVEMVQFLDSANNGQGQGYGNSQQSRQQYGQPANAGAGYPGSIPPDDYSYSGDDQTPLAEDEIPF